MSTPPEATAPVEPMTVAALGAFIAELIASQPDAANWPIHMLDMETDDREASGAENPWDCLVTHAEVDAFDDEQGLLLSLMAWRSRDGWYAAHVQPS